MKVSLVLFFECSLNTRLTFISLARGRLGAAARERGAAGASDRP
jgi:hypothetical protein